jgi:NAD(P)-dependent dehydrogenase (short-subunit alcohol dehydrogenase family)
MALRVVSPNLNLKGKSVIVIGGTSSVGRALSRSLASHGAMGITLQDSQAAYDFWPVA